jgi:biotin carboxyl carrier protein
VAQEIVEVPLTGKIIKVEVKQGDKIKEGDTIVILESMKMENPIVSTVNGTVSKVSVSVDQVVKTGDTIAIIDY